MSDYLEKLERLTNLFERGALSKEEFEEQKKRLLERFQSSDVDSDVVEAAIVSPRQWPSWLRIGAPIALFLIIVSSGLYYVSQKRPSAETAQSQAASLEGQSFDSAIKFVNAASCEPTEGFRDLLERIHQAAIASAGTTDRLVKIAGHADDYEVASATQGSGNDQVRIGRIELNGDWQGLKVLELRHAQWDDGNTESLQLRFAGSAAQVTSVLKQLGFPILPDGKPSQVDGSFIGLETIDGANALICVRGAEHTGSGEAAPTEKGTAPAV